MKQILLAVAVTSFAGAALAAEPRKIDYARDIKPILSGYCFTCHGPDDKERKAGLRLDMAAEAVKEQESGLRAIVPGDPNASELIARVESTGSGVMPPRRTKKQLKPAEKLLLRQWIEQGAPIAEHWAFVPPVKPPAPIVQSAWPKNAIDNFVLQRLEAEGMQPSPEADRYALARRVAIDLTGLPPALDAVDRFVNDKSPDAYEKFVDGVLRSPAYGERWATLWLDLARYADSSGYADDNPRTIWRYRDWVIQAISKNMPFDRFTIEQIAGDLLPNPTEDQIIATAFHRNTLSNDEGGTDDEEFRVAAVVDRVNTTMQVWMGMTMACAQCHNHKYDPLSQEEYYRMYAIFNQTEDADRRDNQPLYVAYSTEDLARKSKLASQIAQLKKELKEAGKKTEIQAKITALEKQLAAVGVPTPIMRELPKDKQRVTKIQLRGNFLDLGKQVTPGVPAVFQPLAKGEPANRLTLARWLVDPKNPLTARVAVNRFWEQLFGRGLVEGSEDYGVRGKLPTHPELLDWLATEFASDWDVRRILRLMATSATYRQSSAVTPTMLERDPENVLYARGPRYRVSAEVIRDQALWAAGLLSGKMYGEPARPPRPNMKLRAAFGGATDWTTSTGEDKYRRAMYTLWRRTVPYPSMVTFDAAGRSVCAVNRPRTNTPLQALVTLNDPVYVEAAQALARRVVKESGRTFRERAEYAFRLCLTRPPREAELDRLNYLYQGARTAYAVNRQAAELMATDPLGPLPPGMEPAELAAWTVVGNVLLNLDEMFLKR